MKQYLKALYLCVFYHWKQRDKGGKRYIYHPIYVSRQVKGLEVKTIALLHDIVEDTNVTIRDLQQKGFSEYVVNGVKCLTRGTLEPYNKYLRRLKLANHKGALSVKIEDLKHNMILSRLSTITDEDLKRNQKYKKTLEDLQKEEI